MNEDIRPKRIPGVYTYSLDRKGDWLNLYVKLGGLYYIFFTNWYDDSKNIGTFLNRGRNSIRNVEDRFKARTGKTLYNAFGYTGGDELRGCVPLSIYYIDPRGVDKNYKNVSKADFSSAFPSKIRGRLPDARKAKRLNGTVDPSPEYPFAFYTKSGHSAELGVYDTRDWCGHYLDRVTYHKGKTEDPVYKRVNADEELTILMPASEYELTEEYEYFYSIRGEDPEAKDVMNCSIGYMHPKSDARKEYRLFHIAAVVLARVNQMMIEAIENVGSYTVLQAVVDCIIYAGDARIGTVEKEFGKLHQEITGARFRMKGINQYAFISQDGTVLETKHSSFDENLEINRLEDIDKWSTSRAAASKQYKIQALYYKSLEGSEAK